MESHGGKENRDSHVCLTPKSVKKRVIRGKGRLSVVLGRWAHQRRNRRSAGPKITFFFFHDLDSVFRRYLIHILFTPGICPPGLRLQIRNHAPTSQEKSELYFAFSRK